ncbi:MAG: substrate-binding domain-containing protein [Spirochaetes bacterium]|jgi:ABC-type sugar transport system substrate-binding protein|nr:substrate-binding domain-containing protein [Spirochaetota bacterium]
MRLNHLYLLLLPALLFFIPGTVTPDQIIYGDIHKTSNCRFAVIGLMRPPFVEAQKAALDFKIRTGIQVTYRAAANYDFRVTESLVTGFAHAGYDGFVIYRNSTPALSETLDMLNSQNTPVVIIGGGEKNRINARLHITDIPDERVTTALKYLVNRMDRRGSLLLITGAINDYSTHEYLETTVNYLKNHPAITLEKIISQTDEHRIAEQEIESFMNRYGSSIDGIIATTSSGSEVVSNLLSRQKNSRIHCVTFGQAPSVIKAIGSGYIDATMSNTIYSQTFLGLEALRLFKKGYTLRPGVGLIRIESSLLTSGRVKNISNKIHNQTQQKAATLRQNYFSAPTEGTDSRSGCGYD